MLFKILLIISIICLAILFIYYLYFLKINWIKKTTNIFDKPVSVIICAKNEEMNLKNNLPLFLDQNYKNYEVIVVNDQSTDNTKLLLKKLQNQYTNLKVVDIENHIHHKEGKKFALTLGIKTAKYEYLLLSDADCKPSSRNWISNISNNYTDSDIILGYGGYIKENSFLNKIIRYDTFNIAQQYFSFSLTGNTYMGVGRNIAYKKSIFFENKGFASHIHLASGDDDLFIQEVATRENVKIEIDPSTHTFSIPINKWKNWIYQKRRHITTSPLYKTKYKILLSTYPLSNFLFWTSLILLFYLNSESIFPLILLLCKLISTYLVNYKLMKKLNVLDLYWIHPLYEFVMLLIQVIFVLLNIISKPTKWKN